tara:strand:+ start:52 stop:2367 length:2316 start_codon:yes stop_codon:yes gene_type:complete
MKYLYILLFLISLNSLKSQVNGTVYDIQTKKPIIGVEVYNSEFGTITNQKGEFEINLNLGESLIFDHIGYDSLNIKSNKNMIVYLSPKVLSLGEISVFSGLVATPFAKNSSSLTLFSEESIKNENANHLQSLLDYVPNLNWSGGTSRPRYFQIRGIGERSHYFGEGPPNFSIGFVIDNIDISGLGMVGQLFDIDQIEIFKGPQSSLFGPNSMGGLISINTNDPSNIDEIKLQSTFGTFNHKNVSAMINRKITESISARFSIVSNYNDGFRENTYLGKTSTNKRDELTVRAKLKFQTNNLNSQLSFIFSDLNNGYDAWSPDNNNSYETYSDSIGFDSQSFLGSSFTNSIYISNKFELVSITSLSKNKLIHAYDGDWANSEFWLEKHNFDPQIEGYEYSFFDRNDRDRSNITQELRLLSDNFIFGYYQRTLNEIDKANGYLFGGSAASGNSEFDFDVNAIYTQFDFSINSSLNIVSNVRFEKNKYNYIGASKGYDNNYNLVDLPSVDFDKTDSMIGFKSSINFTPTENNIYFFSVSQGYKSGGINQQPYLSAINRPYKSETLNNFEIGFKRTSKTMISQINVFYNFRNNQQVSISSQQIEGDPNSFLFYTGNSGSGYSAGLEYEYFQSINDNLDVNFSFAYLASKINEFTFNTPNGEKIGGGRDLAMAPPLTSSLGINYTKNNYFFNSSLSYKDSYYFSDSHNQKSQPYSLLNANFGRDFDLFSVKIWSRNLLNNQYTTRGFYFGLIPPNFSDQLFKSVGDPRELGITIDFNL